MEVKGTGSQAETARQARAEKETESVQKVE